MPKKKWNKKSDVKVQGKKVGVVIENQRGKQKTLLNPHGKYVKYCDELQNGVKQTNDGTIKMGPFGPERLTPEQAAFRAGYKSAVIDQTRAYKARRGGNK